jgi:acyl-CoA synthetase (AMP-forming)/AMP-acid ligase II
MPIGVMLTEGIRFPAVVLALWRLRAIVVPFDAGAAPEDRAARESIVDLPFVVADTNARLSRAATRVLQYTDLESAPTAPLPAGPRLDDDCLFNFTSGTTGQPKALVHTHASFSAVVRRSTEILTRVVRDDIVLATIPLQLAAGINSLVCAPLVAGATVVLVHPFTARIGLQTALKMRTTSLVTVPAVLRLLAALPESMGRPSWRRVNAGSAPLDAATYESFYARFGIRPERSYGMSELGTIASTVGHGETTFRPIVGWPVVELKLMDDGEIAVRADSLCREHGLVPGGTKEPLPMSGGFFLTGDIGRLEADGALTLIGRKKAFIHGPRLHVNPREVEEAVLRMPGVRDVVVVPAPGRHGYEDIRAFIVGDVSEEQVRTFCAAHLALGKRPQIIDFVDAIPRNAIGKAELWRLAGAGC